MPLFYYNALTESGKKTTGMIRANSIELAKDRLLRQNIFVTKLSLSTKLYTHLKLHPNMLFNLTYDFSLLLQAGLPLPDTLQTLEEKYRHSRCHLLLLDLCDQVKQGYHLSQALERYPRIFDQVYITIIRSGEESGALASSFKQLAKLIKSQHNLKKKIVSAMAYPIFLSCFCLFVLAILFFFLIPTMKTLFEGNQLHPLTLFLLKTSDILNQHVISITILFCSLICAGILLSKKKKIHRFFERVLLSLPLTRNLTTEAVLSRFCLVFATLFKGGLPLLETLRLSKLVMKNIAFEQVITMTENQIKAGEKLSEELGRSKYFPPVVVRLLSVAEESGNLAEMMEHISIIYEEDLSKSLNRLTSMLQPVMILFLGAIIGMVLLAVLLPLTDVSSLMD